MKYLKRYWPLLVAAFLLSFLALSNLLLSINSPVFNAVGVFMYPLALGTLALAGALLARNIVNRNTSDADADSGRFVREWHELDPRTRVILSVVQLLVYFVGFAGIAAALCMK